MDQLQISPANSDTSNFRTSMISLAMCVGTQNFLLVRHIVFYMAYRGNIGDLRRERDLDVSQEGVDPLLEMNGEMRTKRQDGGGCAYVTK